MRFSFFFAVFICIFDGSELKLPPKPTTSTTPTPFVYTTQKPRRTKQHQNHNHKNNHESGGRGKDVNKPTLQENEIGSGSAGSVDGESL